MTEAKTTFSQHLTYLERGALNDEATEKLAELVAAVMQLRKKGKITLSLELTPESGMDTVIRVRGEIVTKIPTPDRMSTFLFATAGGDLLRDDPEQKPLFRAPAAVNTETGEITEAR